MRSPIRSPEKALFDYFYASSLARNPRTFDYLPMQNEPVNYPFVVIGNTQTTPAATKNSRNDHIFITIDVWGKQDQRQAVSDLADRFLNTAIGYIKTDEYEFYGQLQDQSKQMMLDTSVENTVFQRGHVEIETEVLQWFKH